MPARIARSSSTTTMSTSHRNQSAPRMSSNAMSLAPLSLCARTHPCAENYGPVVDLARQHLLKELGHAPVLLDVDVLSIVKVLVRLFHLLHRGEDDLVSLTLQSNPEALDLVRFLNHRIPQPS